MKKSIIFFVAFLISSLAIAQAGSLDNSFDSDGKTITLMTVSYGGCTSAAIQSDGKIVVGGYSYNGANTDYALVRYNSDGSLDNTFDTDGKVTTDFGSANDYCSSVAIQANGKIVAAGSTVNGIPRDIALVRYNSDGSLDNTFDSDGKVTTDLGSVNDNVFSVAIQTDGKIVVGGYSYNGTDDDFALVRYNNDGSLDNTFSFDGKVTTALGTADDLGFSIVLQIDGKILVAGYSYSGFDQDFALVRYVSDGSMDNSFDFDGKATTDIGLGIDDTGQSVAIQSDGKILVAGYSYNGSDRDIALVRYNSDGSLDGTFSLDGKVNTDIGSIDDYASSVAIQNDGKILVAGNILNGTTRDFALVRYNSDGTLDNTFESDGIVLTDFGTDNDYGQVVAIQSDGKIVVAGDNTVGTNIYFSVARYYDGYLGIEDINFANSIELYPNPSNNIVQIKSENIITKIEILNMNGSVQKTIYNNNQFSVAELDEGLYFVRLSFENEELVTVEKLVVVK